jgi:electron transfer flavoprotein alpha subunit
MILVFIEHKDCQLNKASLEAIASAQAIGKDFNLKIAAVIPCDKDCSLAQEIAQYDIERVIIAKNAALGIYTPDAYADAWTQIIKETNPQYVVMAHTYQVRDFAPKVAARFGKEVVGDCIRYANDGGKPVFTRRIFSESSTPTLQSKATRRISQPFSRARIAATTPLKAVARRLKPEKSKSANRE